MGLHYLRIITGAGVFARENGLPVHVRPCSECTGRYSSDDCYDRCRGGFVEDGDCDCAECEAFVCSCGNALASCREDGCEVLAKEVVAATFAALVTA